MFLTKRKFFLQYPSFDDADLFYSESLQTGFENGGEISSESTGSVKYPVSYEGTSSETKWSLSLKKSRPDNVALFPCIHV